MGIFGSTVCEIPIDYERMNKEAGKAGVLAYRASIEIGLIAVEGSGF